MSLVLTYNTVEPKPNAMNYIEVKDKNRYDETLGTVQTKLTGDQIQEHFNNFKSPDEDSDDVDFDDFVCWLVDTGYDSSARRFQFTEQIYV